MFPEFVSAVKDAYVNVACAELRASDTRISSDAVSLMTEVDGPSVEELLSAPDDAFFPEAEQRMHAAARLLLGWHTDRDYIGPYGLVRDLQFSKSEAGSRKEASSFTNLATKYCPSINPKVLLDELIRTGSVQDLGNGFYRAVTRSYVPEQLSVESLRYFAQVLHRHLDTLEFNLRSNDPSANRRLERTVYSDFGLAKSELPAFDKYLRQRAQLFADDIDNWLTDRSDAAQKDTVQTGVSFYHYVVNTDDEEDFKKALK